MTLRVAVQMDPLESIGIAGDSSFALMLSAQARGHEIFHYDVGSLTLDEHDGQGRPAPSVRGIDLTVPRRSTYFFDRVVQPVVYPRKILRGRV